MSFNPRLPERLWRWVALAALATVWLAMLLFGTGRLDGAVYERLYAGHWPLLVKAALLLSSIGQPTVLVACTVILGGWLSFRGNARLALVLMLVILVGRALTEVQKYLVGRVRPALEPHLVRAETHAFPSGHSAGSMIFFITLALAIAPERPWRGWVIAIAVLVSLLIGISRVMLGVHWPSDVIGGWTFGLFWVLLTLKGTMRLLARRVAEVPVQE